MSDARLSDALKSIARAYIALAVKQGGMIVGQLQKLREREEPAPATGEEPTAEE